MKTLIRLLKQTLRVALYAIVLILGLAVAALLFVGFTPYGARFAADQIADLISTPDRMIVITNPDGLLNGRLRIDRITVSDTHGPYASIDNLAVDWSPLALLSATFKAEQISASSIEVSRAPVVTEEKTSSGSGFSLPIAIDIARISLPDITLGESLAGRTFELAANGSLLALRNDIILDLSVNRRDEPEARAIADIVFAPNDNRLTLKASINEPAGGLLANMLMLPGVPSVALTLDGEGPLSDWSGRLTGQVDNQPVLEIAGRHVLQDGGRHRLELSGGGQPDALLPPNLRPLFAGQTSLDIAAIFDQAGRLDIESGKLTTGALQLQAEGTLDQTGTNDLRATVTGFDGPVDFRWPLAEGELNLLIDNVDLAVSGVASSARIDATARLQSVQLPQGRFADIELSATGDGIDLANQAGRIDTRLTVAQSSFTSPDLDRLIRAPLTLVAPLHMTKTAIGLDAATLESASIGGTLSGTFNRETQAITGNFRLFALPAILPEALAAKFETTIATEGYIAIAPGGRISLENLIVRSDALEANGNLLLEDNTLTANLGGRLPDLGKFLADAQGAASYSLSASGPLTALDINATINAAEATLAGRTLQALEVSLEGKADSNAPTGTVRATGTIDGQVINIDADLVQADGVAAIPALRAEIGPNTLDGALRFSPQFLPAGDIAFNFPDISLLAALAGQQVQGDLQGNITLSNAENRLGIVLQAQGTSIGRDAVAIRNPAIDLSIPDLGALAAEGTIRAASAGAGNNAATDIVLAFTHGDNRTGFDLKARYDNTPLEMTGNVETGAGPLAVELRSFSAAPRGIAVRLAEPATITVENGTARLTGLALQTGTGRVTVSGTAGENLNITANIASLPASLINSFASGLEAAGTISGQVTAQGAAASPVIGYDLQWDNAEVSQTRAAGLPPLGITANGRFANGTVTLDTRLTARDGLALTGGGSVAVTGNQALALTFNGQLPFAALASQLANQGLSMQGSAAIDLRIGGTTAAPEITGTVSTSGTQLVDARRNLAVNALNANIVFDRDRATISQLNGTLSSGGRISAQGTVGIAAGSGFPADLSLTLDNATYVDGSLFSTTANGTLTLTGPLLTAPILGGRLTLQEAAITIPEKLPASLSEIDIQHRNAPPAVQNQAQQISRDESHGSQSTIGLDLQISAPSGIFVRGRGIDAELGGELTIRGTAADPVVSGGFSMRRGRMLVLTKRLDFTSGDITFGGALIPILNMVATTSSGATTITITVSGQANNPTITFSSSPALPQDEILAQLIFGQSMSRLSALQIAQLADAVSQLAGGRSTSLFNTLRSNLGVDDLDISTDETGQARVSAGKYLNDRTYLELEQGGSSGGRAIINLDIGRGVKLRGEAGADGSGAAGIFYEKEY